MNPSPRLALLALAGALLAAPTLAVAAPQPDFALPEINDKTDRAGQTISPRDYRGFVTIFYFGHET